MPLPSGDQERPSHFAILVANVVPIIVKLPATYKFPFVLATTARMLPFAPESPPRLSQLASLNPDPRTRRETIRRAPVSIGAKTTNGRNARRTEQQFAALVSAFMKGKET